MIAQSVHSITPIIKLVVRGDVILRGIYAEQYKEIGRRIVFYRNLRGLSQEALADKIGISRSYLSKIEAPKSEVSFSLDVIFTIANGLDVDVAAFFNPIEINNPYLKDKDK